MTSAQGAYYDTCKYDKLRSMYLVVYQLESKLSIGMDSLVGITSLGLANHQPWPAGNGIHNWCACKHDYNASLRPGMSCVKR